MTVRTKTALESQITSLIDSDGSPRISAEDLRSVLEDVTDTLFDRTGGGTQPADHTRYALWSDSAVAPTAAEFMAGNTSTNDVITADATPAALGSTAYLHFATLESSLGDIRETGSAFSSRQAFSDTPTERTIGGTVHYAYSTRFAINAYSAAQSWTLTP